MIIKTLKMSARKRT
ncbi:TPA: hypothetical protein OD820_002128 [Escherichia coli]|nr:hypothetical protein [Escherichia coli]